MSKADARNLLTQHHFRRTTARRVFQHLGSIQFDPLKPVGCNHDLVLQARVPDYRVDDWQRLAYADRFVVDAWDKQASLVLSKDWAVRRIYHQWHQKRWTKVLEGHPDTLKAVLSELESRGPLTSTAFEHQVHKSDWEGSWHGPKVTKNVLRGLWHTGRVVTHSRLGNKHVYDLTERVLPRHLLEQKHTGDPVDWLLLLRHQAVGLLRPNASHELWSLDISAAERKTRIATLVEKGKLLPVNVDGVMFHVLPKVLRRFDPAVQAAPEMRFLAPLDQLMWDRKAIEHIFDFEYLWEVYKPTNRRRWGYYVLPVMYGQEFVARVDSKRAGDAWQILHWYWETEPDQRHLEALQQAAQQFMAYLGVTEIRLPRRLGRRTRAALKAAAQ